MAGGSRYGAGRPGWHRKVEHLRSVNVSAMERAGVLARPTFSWAWWNDEGERVASIDGRATAGGVEFSWRQRSGGGDWHDIRVRVALVATACHFGGVRRWFTCPACASRVGKLYIAQKGLACRRCLRLVYASQSEDAIGRTHRRIGKVEARLVDGIGKPPRMHWRTYERLIDRLEADELALNHAFVERFGVMLSQIDHRALGLSD